MQSLFCDIVFCASNEMRVSHDETPFKFPFFRFKSLPLGDDTFCKWFRTTHEDYQLNRRFVNILDIAVLDYMMLSYDSRDTYIINKKKESVNVFIDRAKS